MKKLPKSYTKFLKYITTVYTTPGLLNKLSLSREEQYIELVNKGREKKKESPIQ